MIHQPRNRKFGSERRGVGAIIGGVILASILLTTMLLYFITILNNDQRRASYDIQSAQVDQDKAAEGLQAFRDQNLYSNATGFYLNTIVNNDGSIPLVVSLSALYCIDCPSPNNPTLDKTAVTLNAMEQSSRYVGPVLDNTSYRVDFITERGNIVSTAECDVDLTSGICTNNPSAGIPDFYLSASPVSVVVEPGNPGSSLISVISLNGFNSAVSLSVFSPIPEITAALNPASITPPSGGSDTSDLTFDTDASTPPGTYALTITGVSGPIIHQTAVSVTILEPVCTSCAVNEGIVQGTGSLQLDFRAFGAIFPQLGLRDGVDQKGWNVVTASKYGSATGYPAFEIPYQAHVFFVEKMRNLDPAGEDITLTRKTALITNEGTIPPGQQSVVYICKENPAASDGVEAYNEQTAFKLIPNTPINAAPTVGWVEVLFCQENPGADYNRGNDSCGGGTGPSNGYCPDHTNQQLNGIIMVARGTFTPSLAQYGQTIPYQSAQPGLTPMLPSTGFYWCLYESNTNSACPAPGTFSAASILVYTADRTTMQGGLDIFAHYSDTSSVLPNPGATITWIYPDGEGVVLADNQNLVNQIIPISLPTTNSDGTPIDCAPGQTQAFYIIKINDNFSPEGTRNVYYMTFRMTCP